MVERLKARGKRNHRSLEAHARGTLRQTATQRKADSLRAADAMRARLAARPHTETLELLRQDRDR